MAVDMDKYGLRLVGLAGDGAFEVPVVDILSGAAGNCFSFGRRDDPAPVLVGGRGFKDGAVEAGEGLEVFQIATHAGADLEFVRFISRASERIKAVLGEEPHGGMGRGAMPRRFRGGGRLKFKRSGDAFDFLGGGVR